MKGYRTICFNLAAALPIMLDVVLSVLNTAEARDFVPREWLPWYSLGVVTANIVLRAVTTTPVFEKGETDDIS